MTIGCAFFGSLGRDGEAKTSKNGNPYLKLNVRVGDGDVAQWVSVMTFDQSAIDAADKLTKGAMVYIEGKLSLDEWSGQDGTKRAGLSCMSWHTRLSQIGRNRAKGESDKADPISTGRDRAARSDYAPRGRTDPDLNDDVSF